MDYRIEFDTPLDDLPSVDILRRHFYKLVVWIFCILSIILVCFDWIEYINGISLLAKPVTRGFLFLLFVICILDPKTWRTGKHFFLALPLIALSFLFVTYALLEENIAAGLYYSSKIVFWIVGTTFVYRMLLMKYLRLNHIYKICYFVVLIYSIMICYVFFNPLRQFSQNISIYVVVWCVPLLSMGINKFFNKFFIGLAIVCIFLSFKRGAMLATILSFFCYLAIYFVTNSSFKNAVKIFSLVLSFIFILFISLAIIKNDRPEFFEKRISDIVNKDKAIGSGRGAFYPYIFSNYISSFSRSTFNFFFGFGSRSVENLTGGMYAHSDWLQLLHAYGIFGFFVLIWLHASIFFLLLKGIKSQFVKTPSLAMNYVIFFLLNIYSGMIFSPESLYFGMFHSVYHYAWLEHQYGLKLEKQDT